MDPRHPDQWEQIITKILEEIRPGEDIDIAVATRIMGDFVGYQHPNGNPKTRARRQANKDRDTIELANAIKAMASIVRGQ